MIFLAAVDARLMMADGARSRRDAANSLTFREATIVLPAGHADVVSRHATLDGFLMAHSHFRCCFRAMLGVFYVLLIFAIFGDISRCF